VTDSYKVIIPARYASTRLPGKPLLDISGKSLLQHVYEAACKSNATQVLVATDDQRIFDAAQSFGAYVVMTLSTHMSGTDRLAETVEIINEADDSVIVNVQGDEIGMSPTLIDQVANILNKNLSGKMATLYKQIEHESDIQDPNIVKVVFDNNGHALYFSRLPIPWHKHGIESKYYRHIGLYAYRTEFLKYYSKLPPCELESKESLEQLRVLYNGEKIYIEEACESSGIGIDTEDDLEKARQFIQNIN